MSLPRENYQSTIALSLDFFLLSPNEECTAFPQKQAIPRKDAFKERKSMGDPSGLP
jgi:hypothetical protein